jgi:hypothetical protein
MKGKRSSLGLAACCVTLLAASGALPVRAQQFVIVDQTYTATADNTADSHFTATLKTGLPADWTSPVNYSTGKSYVLLDILEKPSAAPTLYNICFENSDNYACMPYAPTYTATGRDDFNEDFSTFYQYADMKWAMGVNKVSLILKDKDGNKKQGDAMYYPTKVHVVITIVAPGGTYVPPTGAQAGSGGAAAGGTDAPRAGAGGTARAGSGGRRGSAGMGAGGVTGASGKMASAAGADSGEAGMTGGNAGHVGSVTGTAGSLGQGAASGGSATTGSAGKAAAAGNGSAVAGQSAAVGGSSQKPTAGAGAASAADQLRDSGGCSTGRSGPSSAWWFMLSALALYRRGRRGVPDC